MDIESLQLYPWQENAISFIDHHKEYISDEEIQSLSTFDLNRLSRIQISLPSGSGHSTLAGYLAFTYPSIILYSDIDELLSILGKVEKKFDDLYDSKSDAITWFELSHYIFHTRGPGNTNVHQVNSFNRLKKKISDKQLVIIDNATETIEKFKLAMDVVFNVANGAIVLLG